MLVLNPLTEDALVLKARIQFIREYGRRRIVFMSYCVYDYLTYVCLSDLGLCVMECQVRWVITSLMWETLRWPCPWPCPHTSICNFSLLRSRCSPVTWRSVWVPALNALHVCNVNTAFTESHRVYSVAWVSPLHYYMMSQVLCLSLVSAVVSWTPIVDKNVKYDRWAPLWNKIFGETFYLMIVLAEVPLSGLRGSNLIWEMET